MTGDQIDVFYFPSNQFTQFDFYLFPKRKKNAILELQITAI